jgi:hypothetical protein
MSNTFGLLKLAALTVCCAAGIGMTQVANAGGWLGGGLYYNGGHYGHNRYNLSISLGSLLYGGHHSSHYYAPGPSYYYPPRPYYYAPRPHYYYDVAPAYSSYYDAYPSYSYDDDYPGSYGYYGPSTDYSVSYYGSSYRHGWDREDWGHHDHDGWRDRDHDRWPGPHH